MAAVYPINICNSSIEIIKMLLRNCVLVQHTIRHKILGGENLGKFGKLQEIRQNFYQKFSFLKAKSRNIQCIASQLANSASKLKKHVVILRIYINIYIHRIAASQLAIASATLLKLLSYLCCIMFQPADNQQVHPIDTSYRMVLQTIVPSLVPSQLTILQFHVSIPYFCAGVLSLVVQLGGLYSCTTSDNVPA